MKGIVRIAAIFAISTAPLALAHADTVVVNGTDVIYAAGTQSAEAVTAGGTIPKSLLVTGGATLTLSATGSVSLDNGLSTVDPDGNAVFERVATSSNTGFGSISGITAPLSGYLVGVFLGPGGPSGTAPAALDFTTGSGIAFTSLSPLLDQTFFIGDGLTGSGTGNAPGVHCSYWRDDALPGHQRCRRLQWETEQLWR